MGEGLDKIGHSFAQKLSLNLFGPSKISDQILYWYTYLKGLKDPPDWVRVFIVTSVDVISYWTWGCSEPQQGNDCSSCGTAQWSHGISRIKKDCYRMKTFIWEQNNILNGFLPLFFPLTGQSSKISSDPYNCLVLLLYYLINEEELA